MMSVELFFDDGPLHAEIEQHDDGGIHIFTRDRRIAGCGYASRDLSEAEVVGFVVWGRPPPLPSPPRPPRRTYEDHLPPNPTARGHDPRRNRLRQRVADQGRLDTQPVTP